MKKLVIMLVTMAMLLSTLSFAGCKKADYNIGILQVATHSALDDARKGFEDTLTAWAEGQGKTIKFDERNSQGDPNNEQTEATALANKNHNLLLGISTGSARALANSTATTPVLFTAVTDPKGEDLANKSQGGTRGNTTGTSDINPVEQQIELITDIVLDCKNIGFIHNSSEQNSTVQFELAEKKVAELNKTEKYKNNNLELVKITASKSDEIQAQIDGALNKVDAVYVPTDNLMAENITIITSACYAHHIPVITGEKGVCDDGEGVATLGVDYYKLGVQTGKMAIKILSGEKKVSEIPFEQFNEAPSFFINEKNAKLAGLSDEIINKIKAKYSK